MKTAIILKDNELSVLHEEKVRVIIFNFKEEKVVGVENEILENQTKDSIVSWLHQRSIKQIYLSDIDEESLYKLKVKGIRVKTLETLENDKLYNTLALSSLQMKKIS